MRGFLTVIDLTRSGHTEGRLSGGLSLELLLALARVEGGKENPPVALHMKSIKVSATDIRKIV